MRRHNTSSDTSLLTIGLMSGTSADGVDAVLWDNHQMAIQATRYLPYPPAFAHALHALITSDLPNLQAVGEISHTLTQYHVQAVQQLLQQTRIPPAEIRAIGFHGHTICHWPYAPAPFSWQIGNPSLLSTRTQIPVVADFRQADVVAGGQGAPLAPLFHERMWQHPTESRAIVNIGGIANVTYLPAICHQPALQKQAWDTGPGNALIDWGMRQYYNQPYDAQGAIARQGTVHEPLLAALQAHPYFRQAPPKSTGRETFHGAWVQGVADSLIAAYPEIASLPPPDWIATLTALTASTIVQSLITQPALEGIWICGGGAHNPALVAAIRTAWAAATHRPLAVGTTQMGGVDPDWVESCAFAWLAFQTWNRQPVHTAHFTGALHPVVLGGVYYPSPQPTERTLVP